MWETKAFFLSRLKSMSLFMFYEFEKRGFRATTKVVSIYRLNLSNRVSKRSKNEHISVLTRPLEIVKKLTEFLLQWVKLKNQNSYSIGL